MELHVPGMAVQVLVTVTGTQFETAVRYNGAIARKGATKTSYYKICCGGNVLSDPKSCDCLCQGYQTFDHHRERHS